jgi:hypothetical protein
MVDMASFFRILGAIGIGAGFALIGLALWPLKEGQPVALAGSPFITQATAAILIGIIGLGFSQLIAVNQRTARSLEGLRAYFREQDDGSAEAPAAAPGRDILANIPNYRPDRDPPVVKEGTYRDYAVLTLEDGSLVVHTTSGWKRFRQIRDFDRLLTAA